MADHIPIKLPSGGKAVVLLPETFTVADATHMFAFLSLYIEDPKATPEEIAIAISEKEFAHD